MAQTLDTFQLNTVNDYKYLAFVLGDKLRNPNFQPTSREIFLKSLLQQLRPSCSFKAYERIQKSINQISHQKDLDLKEEKQRALINKTNKKQKKLVNAKESGKLDAFGRDLENYDDFDDANDYDSQDNSGEEGDEKYQQYKH